MPPRYEVEWDERYGEVVIKNAYGDVVSSWEGEDLDEAMADGHLDPRNMNESALKYAVKLGRVPEYDVHGNPPWKMYKDPDFDCSVAQTEADRAKVKLWIEENLAERGLSVEKFSLHEMYGGGLSLDVEATNGRVYSQLIDHSGDWKERLNIHPDEEYYECLVYQDLATSLEYFDAELIENTRAIKGYEYMRNLEEEEDKKRYQKELQPLSFEEWLKKVDELSYKHLGVSFHDLPDVTTYRMIYDDGTDPKTYFFEDLMPEIEADFGYAFQGDYE